MRNDDQTCLESAGAEVGELAHHDLLAHTAQIVLLCRRERQNKRDKSKLSNLEYQLAKLADLAIQPQQHESSRQENTFSWTPQRIRAR